MKLHYRTLGHGPPLIVLHGLLGSLDNWQPLARRLSTQFTVWAVDLRNHGQSPHSDDAGYEAMAGDVAEFLAEHGLPRAHLLGHSMGGKVAMQFALDHPDRVDKLVLVDIAPRAYPPRHAEALTALLALDLRRCQRREQLDARLAEAVPDAEVRRFLLKNVGRDAQGGFRWKANVRALGAAYERLAGAIGGDQPCDRPALFLSGARSDYVSTADHDCIRRLFPRAEFCVIADAGHWVHTDQPDAVFAAVRNFLAANAPG